MSTGCSSVRYFKLLSTSVPFSSGTATTAPTLKTSGALPRRSCSLCSTRQGILTPLRHLNKPPRSVKVLLTIYMRAQNSNLFQGSTEEHLKRWLVAHGVSYEAYGQGGHKSTRELLTEVQQGECQLHTKDAKAVRSLEVLNLLVIAENGMVLMEDFQVRPNGDKRHRDLPVSEKMLPGEDWKGAVQRAVTEELGSVLDGPPVIEIRESSHECTVEEKMSLTYPGLLSRYTLHKVEAAVQGLPQADFMTREPRPGGFLESHWVWMSRGVVDGRTGQEGLAADLAN